MKIFRALLCVLFSLSTFLFATGQEIKNPNGYIQLFQVSSDLPTASDKYIYENDTIKVTYYFWGNRGIMQISVFNKLNAPIYIDWKKSSMMSGVNTLVYGYEGLIKSDNAKLYKSYLHEGRSLGTMDYESDYQMGGGTSGKKKAETMTEVKAKGFYMSLRFHLVPNEFFKFETTATSVSEMRNDNAKQTTQVYEAKFDSANSPLKFSSLIVYSITKDFAVEKKIDNKFWVGMVREMDAKHFMGEKTGKTPEGYPIFKFPYRKSMNFYIEVDKKNAVAPRVGK